MEGMIPPISEMDRPPSTLDAAHEMSAADQDRFYADMNGNDALTVVVRAAIYIESHIIHLIEANLDAVSVNKMDLTYLQRVYLAAAIGMHPRLVKPLKALGEIRNKFAHRLDASLSENEAENFYSAFDATDKQIIQAVYQRTRKASAKKRPSQFKSLPALERFTLCITALRAALISARAQSALTRSTS